jgi:hypothetical protein
VGRGVEVAVGRGVGVRVEKMAVGGSFSFVVAERVGALKRAIFVSMSRSLSRVIVGAESV